MRNQKHNGNFFAFMIVLGLVYLNRIIINLPNQYWSGHYITIAELASLIKKIVSFTANIIYDPGKLVGTSEVNGCFKIKQGGMKGFNLTGTRN